MTLVANQTADLTDAAGRDLGRFAVEEVRAGKVLGTFVPGPEYGLVRSVFEAFDEAVEHQVLSVVDDIDKQIASFGLRVDGVAVWDVQIYRDGAASFRLPPAGVRNGTHG